MEQILTCGAYGSFMPDTHRRLVVDEIQVHQTLGRALRTLEAVWNQGVSSTLSSIADAAGLDRSTALRVLSSLQAYGYVHRDPDTKTYRTGYMAQRLGAVAELLAVKRSFALPFLGDLAAITGATAFMATLEGTSVVYRAAIPALGDERGAQIAIDVAYPAHAAAAGKVLLAALPTDQVRTLYSATPLVRGGSRTITDRESLFRHLQMVRGRGYAVERDEAEDGRSAVAVPFVNSRGHSTTAIGVVLNQSLDIDQSGRELIAVCRTIAGRIFQYVMG
ncbi:IclR family transcriptional regulator [Tsuneonella suprasediminis]|uniref:IclR family transcriptional regulator n=1 Tax=Tsuneonella suprasediminis TaxID=2306996 RepID=UPI002F9321D1